MSLDNECSSPVLGYSAVLAPDYRLSHVSRARKDPTNQSAGLNRWPVSGICGANQSAGTIPDKEGRAGSLSVQVIAQLEKERSPLRALAPPNTLLGQAVGNATKEDACDFPS